MDIRRAISTIILVCAVAAASGASRPSAQAPPRVSVLTNRNDNARTGANLQETVLNVNEVSSGRFGLLFSLPVDGYVYAQPLYVAGLATPGGVYDALVVATEHNSVYAFDADGNRSDPLWQVNLGPSMEQDPAAGENHAGIPGCPNLTPEVGITSTPVIDPATGTIYVVAKTRDEDGAVRQRLHALSLSDGSPRGTVEIQATIDNGEYSIAFDPLLALNRPGLLLVNGEVFLAFGSHCDYGDYHGWVIAYDAATLTQSAVFPVTPSGEKGSVWQSGAGLSADADGHIYVVTSNGTFSTNRPNLSDSVVKLVRRGGALEVADSFTPKNQDHLESIDADLGSGAALLLPETNLVVAGGKEGVIYVIDRDDMGGFDPDEDRVIQSFQATDVPYVNNIHGTPLFWATPAGGRMYMWGENEPLKAFRFDGARFDPTPEARSVVQAPPNAMPGGFLSLSADGGTAGTGIIWASIARDADATLTTVSGVLRAFDAADVTREIWNSDLDSRDDVGNFAKFCSPTIANGKVYMATFSGAVRVYGLRSSGEPPPGPALPSSPNPPNGATWVTVTPTLSWTSADATSFEIRLGATNPPPTIIANTTERWYAPPTLNGDTTYFWQIIARNSTAATTGPIWSFRTETAAPSAPGGASPSNGATGVSTDPTLIWSAPGATSYDVKLGTSNPPPQVSTGLTSASYSVSPLANGTTYFWQIVAHNIGGVTEGPVWSFTTVAAPPAAPSHPNPDSGASGVAITPMLTWAAPGATSYDVKFGPSDPPAVVSASQTTASYAPGTLAYSTTYFWQILARNAGGVTAGPVWSLTTMPAPPPGPLQNASPSNRATAISTSASLIWTSANATSYDVKFGTTSPPPLVSSGQAAPWYLSPPLSGNTIYFWQIVARNSAGIATGPVWSFITGTSRGGSLRSGDFDGDGRTDVGVYRPSTGGWHVLQTSTNCTTSVSYMLGTSGDVLVPGDYDGDGKTDPTIYRPSTGAWHVLASSTNYSVVLTTRWGLSTDTPVPGDYDGDGRTDIAVFRPSSGAWYILRSSANNATSFDVSWGLSADRPIPADYDADGKTDVAVFRPSTGGWYILQSSTNNTNSIGVSWGLSTDVPAPGDYDGDGKADMAVYRPSTGGWYMLRSSVNYTSSTGYIFGGNGDTAVPGDYDGDGRTDLAVFRPSTGGWLVLESSGNFTTMAGYSWGLATDVPALKRP